MYFRFLNALTGSPFVDIPICHCPIGKQQMPIVFHHPHWLGKTRMGVRRREDKCSAAQHSTALRGVTVFWAPGLLVSLSGTVYSSVVLHKMWIAGFTRLEKKGSPEWKSCYLRWPSDLKRSEIPRWPNLRHIWTAWNSITGLYGDFKVLQAHGLVKIFIFWLMFYRKIKDFEDNEWPILVS